MRCHAMPPPLKEWRRNLEWKYFNRVFELLVFVVSCPVVFFRLRVLIDHPVWGLCLVPGVLGILLSFNACRKRHHQCKPPVEGERENRRRNGPHPCALPIHMVLLLSVVVALGMHASALLFCEVRVTAVVQSSLYRVDNAAVLDVFFASNRYFYPYSSASSKHTQCPCR